MNAFNDAGHLFRLAAVFLYAVALILVPRMARVGRRRTGEHPITATETKQGH
jgi:hypothetical protein